jgi:hypothetical protein
MPCRQIPLRTRQTSLLRQSYYIRYVLTAQAVFVKIPDPGRMWIGSGFTRQFVLQNTQNVL